jgi:hypothetical protein
MKTHKITIILTQETVDDLQALASEGFVNRLLAEDDRYINNVIIQLSDMEINQALFGLCTNLSRLNYALLAEDVKTKYGKLPKRGFETMYMVIPESKQIFLIVNLLPERISKLTFHESFLFDMYSGHRRLLH